MKVRLRLAKVFVAALTPFLAAGGFAQELLPPDGFAPAWKAAGRPRTFIEKDLFNHIDGGAELFLEFGFRKLTVQTYASGETEIDYELYEMSEAASALGIYLMNAGRETPWTEIPARNSSEEAQIVAIKGPFYLKVNNFAASAALRPAMIALIRSALDRLTIPAAPIETPLDRLPATGLVAGSGRLIRGPVGLQPYYTFGEGDIFALGGETFAAIGEYRDKDGSSFSRLVIPYASAEAATSALSRLRANLDPYLKVVAERADGFDFLDFQKTYGRVERRGELLEIQFKRSRLD